MKRVLPRLLVVLFAIGLMLPVASADEPVYARIVMPVLYESEIPKDIDRVNAAVDAFAKRKIGASVQLVPILYVSSNSAAAGIEDPVRLSEIGMLEKQGITFDVLPAVLPHARFIELSALLDEYGSNIRRLVDKERQDHARMDGQLTELPSVSDYVASAGLTMRKDVLTKHGIHWSTVRSLEDVDALLRQIHQAEPELKLICANQTRRGLLSRFQFMDAVPNSVCDLDPNDSTRMVNYYATQPYLDTLRRIRRWHEAGYLPEQIALQNIRASQLVKAGELLGYFCAFKPGIDFEESTSCGREMVTVPLIEPAVTRRSLDIAHWGISATCLNPGKAMQLLDLLYSDSELANLLVYGLEGIHYVITEDGTIDYPEGVDASNVGYANSLPWLMPNQLLTHVWRGNDPDLWQKTDQFNKAAKVAPTLDFRFDPTPVEDANNALNRIALQYAYGLETGQLDPEVYLPVMLSEMESAGAQRVVAEAQRQYAQFLEGRLRP